MIKFDAQMFFPRDTKLDQGLFKAWSNLFLTGRDGSRYLNPFDCRVFRSGSRHTYKLAFPSCFGQPGGYHGVIDFSADGRDDVSAVYVSQAAAQFEERRPYYTSASGHKLFNFATEENTYLIVIQQTGQYMVFKISITDKLHAEGNCLKMSISSERLFCGTLARNQKVESLKRELRQYGFLAEPILQTASRLADLKIEYPKAIEAPVRHSVQGSPVTPVIAPIDVPPEQIHYSRDIKTGVRGGRRPRREKNKDRQPVNA